MKTCLAIPILFLILGCESSALETGWYPHKLSDSADERKAYYAEPYSPESTAKTNSTPDPALRRPNRY